MNGEKKRFFGSLLAGALITVLVFSMDRGMEIPVLQRLCDGATTAMAVLLGSGLIHYVANKGFFRVMRFGLKVALETTMPWYGSHRDEKFEEFRERREEEQKSSRPTLMAGLVYLALTGILLAAHYLFPGV